MPSPHGLSPGRGKKAPSSRPGRRRKRCPGSGPVVADAAGPESSEFARSPGFKETGKDFQGRDPAPPPQATARRPGAPPPLTAPPGSGAAGHWGAWVRRGPGRRRRGRAAGFGSAEGPGAGFPHPPSRGRGTKARTCVGSTELRGGAGPPARTEISS
uniref:Uncharacterized protein LOC112812285 n=1 Tax=Callorhinus ursinus TaxID=34884 RepID=A0A3Q7MX47_CALUR|nr:uncharacterized protein LOC112812285 [Callorhinus ursinus]